MQLITLNAKGLNILIKGYFQTEFLKPTCYPPETLFARSAICKYV